MAMAAVASALRARGGARAALRVAAIGGRRLPVVAAARPTAAPALRRFSSAGTGAAAPAGETPVGGVGSETHGGDDIYKVQRLVADFSVTTNALGPVPSALAAMKQLMEVEMMWVTPRGGDVSAILEEVDEDETHTSSEHLASAPAVEHYPARTDVALEELTAGFLAGPSNIDDARRRLLFGNGASELIDLLGRMAPEGPYCISPHVQVQYREYQRACTNAGRKPTTDPKEASIICLVNPNNPTGDFQERAEMEAWIAENAAPGSWVLVDESMLFWAGPDWYERGVSAEFIKKMAKQHIQIFLVQSWTKIFSCTGLRIGTVLCPTVEKRDQVYAKQVPWSVNPFAREYLKAALQDTGYLQKTWRNTPKWRAHMVGRLQRLHPEWKIYGKPWLSWIWIDTGSTEVADSVYQAALECGCPVRHAKNGYDLPTFIRLAVRRPYDFSVLYQALLQRECTRRDKLVTFGTYADVQPSVVEGVRLVHIDDLLPHEQVLQDRAEKLQEYVRDLPKKILPAIIVDSQYQVVIDGHHRLELFRAAGMQIVPVVSLNYDHEDILVNPPGKEPGVTKETVISSATRGKLLSPKSTQHVVRSRGGQLLPIIVLAPQIAELVS